MSKSNTIEIGKKLLLTKRFSIKDIEDFSKVSGDANPLHLNQEFAEKSRFKYRIVHGMLVGSMFSNIIGNTYPMAIYLSQSLNFKAPVYIDEEVTAEITVDKCKSNRIFYLNTIITKEKGNSELNSGYVADNNKITVITGEAVIMIDNNKIEKI